MVTDHLPPIQAVIEDTENAANHILDAADRIASYVDSEKDWTSESGQAELRDKIRNDIQEILMACTFQDLTGQRIRNTLNNLHSIEERLSSTFERLGIDVQTNQSAIQQQVQKASSQNEVDDIFSTAKEESGKAASQDDIDGMFD